MGRKRQQKKLYDRTTDTVSENMETTKCPSSDQFQSSGNRDEHRDLTTHQNNPSVNHCSPDSDKGRYVDFSDLPDDVLYMIFKYLSPAHLCCLRRVSRRFLLLASADVVWQLHAKKCGLLRGYDWQCSAMEMCRVAPHWKEGLFKQVFVARQKTRQIPWLFKEEDGLWLSKSSCIHYFYAKPSGHLVEDRSKCLQGSTKDVTRFVVKKNTVVSGCSDGSVCCWNTSGNHLTLYNQVHRSETHCVDFTDSVIVSGSRDTTCKVLRFDSAASSGENDILRTCEAGERVWSLKISPTEKVFAAGLAGCLDDPPVILWDLESGTCVAQLSVNHRRGAGVLDLRFESPNELLTCGYDTFIRLWDLRTHTCVCQWEEPFDSALYCIETDGRDTMAVGTARHGMVRLWDKRHSEPVQMMYCRNSRSPVYSLAMDYGHLYIALDTGLTIMDFT